MSGLKVLTCGGSCAGSALAYWLAQRDHRVVVVERFETLRATGAQLDISSQGLEAIERMGLLDNIRIKRVNEIGILFVDSHGMLRRRSWPVLYDATKDSVEYVFGKTIESFEQNGERVVLYFSDNSSDTFDLVVEADGQRSRIRGMIRPAGSLSLYREQGVYVAYWVIPRTEAGGILCTFYTSSRGRMIMRRSHRPTETQVFFTLRDDSKELQIYFAPQLRNRKNSGLKDSVMLDGRPPGSLRV
ncbi:hypothetical protein ACHAQJ_003571 [Trichoderma viride]